MLEYDVIDVAKAVGPKAVGLTEKQTRDWLRKLWNDGILVHEKNAQWKFTQQEFNMLCYIYKLEKTTMGVRSAERA